MQHVTQLTKNTKVIITIPKNKTCEIERVRAGTNKPRYLYLYL